MKNLYQFSSGIDRLFRFVEMVGVTALLATVLRKAPAGVVAGVLFCGTLLALIYLIEPAVGYVANRIVGEKPNASRVLAAVMAILFGLIIAVEATPFVAVLAFLIGETISPHY